MTAIPFLIFATVFVGLICAHFLPAYRAWWISQGQEHADIDPDYVRIEEYFGRSFRAKVAEWIERPVTGALPDGTRLIQKGRELVRVSEAAEYGPGAKSEEILVVHGNFRCGEGSTFDREIYVSADAVIGERSLLQAIAVDGDLSIGSGARVVRWVDSSGHLLVGENVRIGSRATAAGSIVLQTGCRVASAFAPVVQTPAGEGRNRADSSGPEIPPLEIPVVDPPPPIAQRLTKGGVDLKKLTRLSSDCWLYEGDLTPNLPLLVRKRLIVRGTCVLPPQSVLEADIKAKEAISIGEHSICRGNVVADGDITFHPWSEFHGVVHSEKTLRICRGVRGGNGRPVAAYSRNPLLLEEDVVVHGKVVSGDHVSVSA